MKEQISRQIENINDSLAWIKKYRPDDYSVKFVSLVEQRRKLNILLRAAKDNPAIAAFGKSQVGKSYLMSCILQKRESSGCMTSFKVRANGQEYDFIKEINPIGDGKEATGVVTRFTSFKRNTEKYDEKYPVMLRCLSLSDIIVILCDSYFNDLYNYTISSESAIKEEIEKIVSKYSNKPDVLDPVIKADDILEIKNYIKKHVNNAQVLSNSSYFSELSLVIEKIPVTDYVNVFQILWDKDSHITGMFQKLLNILGRVNFSEYLYLPIEAVLHEGVKENTVMSVDCLKLLLDPDNKCCTDVYAKKGNTISKLGSFTKSEVCAITSEAIFKISNDFITSINRYNLEGISSSVQGQINKNAIEMSILKDNDLLDFPGARSRQKNEREKLGEATVILECFLRGKVAYLFNKYNDSLLINVLLYCHHDSDNDVADLWQLLNKWVTTYVGNSANSRRATIEKSGLSPLFYIATMFNKDMQTRGNETEDNKNAISARWKARFERVLYDSCLKRDIVDWVKNWSAEGEPFNNSYLLRDFKYSGPTASRLFDGFIETGEEKNMMIPQGYYNDLRETFIMNNSVCELFDKPEVAWDLAATINNDGSLYIIENLAKVAERMNDAREKLFEDTYRSATKKIKEEIKDYHISTDAGEILAANIRKARSVFRELSFTCNEDNLYFGHLLNALQMTESQVYKIIHEEIMQNPKILNPVNNFKNYEIIRKDCEHNGHSLAACKSIEECWQAVILTYSFGDKEDAEAYLLGRGVKPDTLFDPEKFRKLKNSNIIADYIFDAWCRKIKSVEFMNRYTGDHTFNSSVMAGFIDNTIELAKNIRLSDTMAEFISPVVDIINVNNVNQNFLADVLSGFINDFIMDFGFSTYDEEKLSSIRKIGESQRLPIFNFISKQTPAAYDEAQLTNLFNEMSDNPRTLIPSFEEHYYKWIEYMYISYISYLEIPDYNPEANNAIGAILSKLQEITKVSA